MNTAFNILLISSRKEALQPLAEDLRSDTHNTVVWVSSAHEALDAAMRIVPVLAVIDDPVGDLSGLEIVRRLLQINAFIYTAVISDMAPGLFHDESEGLGIVAQLPLVPDAQDAKRLLTLVRDLMPT